MTTPSADALVLLTTAANNVEAAGIRSLLEAEGIEVLVQGEHHRALEGALGAYVELRVMVRQRDLDEARELLEEMDYAEHLPPDPEQPVGALDASIDRFNAARPDTEHDDSTTSQARPLYPAIAVILGLMIPLGTGHFYARRWLTGMAIGVLLGCGYVLLLLGYDVTLAVLALIAVDAVGGAIAVRRRNAALRDQAPGGSLLPGRDAV